MYDIRCFFMPLGVFFQVASERTNYNYGRSTMGSTLWDCMNCWQVWGHFRIKKLTKGVFLCRQESIFRSQANVLPTIKCTLLWYQNGINGELFVPVLFEASPVTWIYTERWKYTWRHKKHPSSYILMLKWSLISHQVMLSYWFVFHRIMYVIVAFTFACDLKVDT